ncbi:MAG TPA: hypothetical protein VHW69_05800 [Rhizomicrobium sp.]|nr:hypothetical protein [Rhizomicrobium sp.]
MSPFIKALLGTAMVPITQANEFEKINHDPRREYFFSEISSEQAAGVSRVAGTRVSGAGNPLRALPSVATPAISREARIFGKSPTYSPEID